MKSDAVIEIFLARLEKATSSQARRRKKLPQVRVRVAGHQGPLQTGLDRPMKARNTGGKRTWSQ